MKFYISAYSEIYCVEYNDCCIEVKSIDDIMHTIIRALDDSILEVYYSLSNEFIQCFRLNWQNSRLFHYCVKNVITVRLIPVIKDESIWVSNRFSNGSVSIRYYYKSNHEDFYCRRFSCSEKVIDRLCFNVVECLRKELGHANNVTVQTESLFNVFQQNGYCVKLNSFTRELYSPSKAYFDGMWHDFYNAIRNENVQSVLSFIDHGLYTKLSCVEYNQLLEGAIPQKLREVANG